MATAEQADLLARVSATALMAFELQHTDINIDGMYINTEWLGLSSIPMSPNMSIPIEEAINRAYPEGMNAKLRIEGDVKARDAMRFLRAIHANNDRGGAPLTRVVLLKEW